jgi:protein-S-isoprenylcysteine O-methyltransferase Ste14
MRDVVLFAIYFAAFWGGAVLWGMAGKPYMETAQWLARFLGPGWLLPVFSLATLAMMACWAIRVWGASYLSAGVVWNPSALTGALLVGGPYRYVRNPLYLGNLLMAIGFGLLATPYGFAIIIVGHAIFITMLVKHEAKGLRATFGPAYDAYVRVVPAIVPRFTPAPVIGDSGHPSLVQGLKAEIFSAACALAMILLVTAYSGRLHWLFLGLIIGGWLAQKLTMAAGRR